jgi:hypothetical protein
MIGEYKANKGDISEAILAAAIAAKFKKRIDVNEFKNTSSAINIGNLPSVTKTDVENVLRILVRSFKYSTSVNDIDRIKKTVETKIYDNIQVSVGIPQKSAQFLKKESNWSEISNIFSAAITKVNSDPRLKAKAYGLSVNKKNDIIIVRAIGTESQTATKVDIRVEIINQGQKLANRSNQISLKYDAPQFAQAVGLEFGNFGKIFDALGLNNYTKFNQMFLSEVMGVYPDIIGKKFDNRDAIKSSDEVKALKKVAKEVFSSVADQLNQKLTGVGKDQFRRLLASYCKERATKNESGVELVKFTTKGGAVTQTFGQSFFENVANADLKVHKDLGGSDPKIIIYSGTSATKVNTLIQFRYRTDATAKDRNNKYKILMRSYVESGDLLYKL